MLFRDLLLIMTATFCFSIITNIQGKNKYFAALGGGIAWFFYSISINQLNFGIYSVLVASMAAGIYSEIMARVLKAPVTAFVICSIIPLVPGGAMYNTMFQAVEGNVEASISLGIQAIATAVYIAVGVFLITSSFRLFAIIKKKLEIKKHHPV